MEWRWAVFKAPPPASVCCLAVNRWLTPPAANLRLSLRNAFDIGSPRIKRKRDTPSVSLPDRHWLEASLVIPRRTSGGLLLDTGRGHSLDRFCVGCRCGRGGGWFFHDRGARSQEHGSNRQ
jgi:hypothetical protein